MPKVIDKDRWALGKRLYSEGESLAGIARALDVSVTAVRNHKDKDGWERAPLATADVVEQAFKPEQTHEVTQSEAERLAALQAELAAAKAEAAELAAQVDSQKSTYEVKIYENPEQVEAYLGTDRIDDLVELAFGRINTERTRQGLDRIPAKDIDPKRYEITRAEILQDFVDRRTKWINPESAIRCVKLYNPHTKTIWQCPVEDQFNNEKGNKGSALRRYKDKGHKLVTPYMCQRYDCWNYADQEGGKFRFEGYCSGAHLATDPYISAERKAGITTSAMVGF